MQNLKDKHSRDTNVHCKHTFYPRVSNLTSITFNADELNILNKGINYCIPPNFNKNQIAHEIISAETATKAIPDPNLQNEARYLISNKFKKVMKARTSYDRLHHM